MVIPLYNEEESIAQLYQKVTDALEGYGRPYEIVIVDTPPGSYKLKTIGLYASDLVILPVIPSHMALDGLADALEVCCLWNFGVVW